MRRGHKLFTVTFQEHLFILFDACEIVLQIKLLKFTPQSDNTSVDRLSAGPDHRRPDKSQANEAECQHAGAVLWFTEYGMVTTI